MDKKKEKKIIFFSTSKVNEKSEYGLSKKRQKILLKKKFKIFKL